MASSWIIEPTYTILIDDYHYYALTSPEIKELSKERGYMRAYRFYMLVYPYLSF